MVELYKTSVVGKRDHDAEGLSSGFCGCGQAVSTFANKVDREQKVGFPAG